MDGSGRRPAGDLRADALRLLGRRELSRHQLRARLVARGAEAGAVEDVIAQLAERGLIDDARVARAHARTAVQVKRRGRDRIRRELAQMGIDEETARAALDEACGSGQESAALDTVIRRRARGIDVSDPAALRRLAGALFRQGFDGDDVRRAIARLRGGGAADED